MSRIRMLACFATVSLAACVPQPEGGDVSASSVSPAAVDGGAGSADLSLPGALVVAPTSLTWDDIAYAQKVTVTNVSNVEVSGFAVNATTNIRGPGGYHLINGCFTLAPGASCTITVTPIAPRTLTLPSSLGRLNIHASSDDASATVALSVNQ